MSTRIATAIATIAALWLLAAITCCGVLIDTANREDPDV